MNPPDLSNDPSSNALRQALQALTDEELEHDLALRVWFKPDCPPEIRRIFARRKEMAREVLEGRRLAAEKRQ